MIRYLLSAAFAAGALAASPVVQAQAVPPAPAAAAAPAVIADTSVGGGNRGAIFFYVGEIDGAQPATDAERMSGRLSFFVMPRGYTAPADVRREVEPGPRRLLLVGKHASNDLFQNLGGLPKVSGIVEVNLLPGRQYRVNGVVDAFRREVWLQDEDGVVPNTHIVDNRVRDANKQEMAGAKFTCCNLHYEQDWISDANFVSLPMIPAGARIVVKDYGRFRAHVLIEGEPMRIGLDYGRKKETQEAFVAKLVVAEDPRLRLATFEPAVRQAIERGQVAIGMTREQVLMSLGYPRTDLNPSLDAPRWVYVTYQHEEYAVVWGPDGRVQSVESEDEIALLDVLHKPR